jgi:radical SAM-linked protein
MDTPQERQISRYRIIFSKTSAMRYTSHLDLHRTWERTIRRAGLPLSYSQGYKPHPKLNLASALPLGFTSREEIIDLWLDEQLSLDEIESRLIRALPPGLGFIRINKIDPGAPSLQSEIYSSEYLITFLKPFPDLEQRKQALLESENLPRNRRNKEYDLRPLIISLETITPDEDGLSRMIAHLATREGATGRPDEVVEALGGDVDAVRVQRIRLAFKNAEPFTQ